MLFIRMKRGAVYAAFFVFATGVLAMNLQFLNTVMTSLRAGDALPVCSVERYGDPYLSLSFDLERGEENIDEILAILDAYEAKATFFAVGEWAREHPALVRKIADAGHELMNHSDTNLDLTHQSEMQIRAELSACNDALEELTGVRPHLFRLPYGKYDETVLSACRAEGMIPVLWSIDSGDLDGRNANASAEDVIAELKAGEIVLFHNDAVRTPVILQKVLAYLSETELKPVPMSVMVHRENWEVDENGRQQLKTREILTIN